MIQREAAVALLDQIEELEGQGDQASLGLDESWWRSRFLEVPDDVLCYMARFKNEERALKHCPWNRRTRRRLEPSDGVVIHLFAGDGSAEWTRRFRRGTFETLTVELKDGQDLHDLRVWSYWWGLAKKGSSKQSLALAVLHAAL